MSDVESMSGSKDRIFMIISAMQYFENTSTVDLSTNK